jgi:hypothetical protein
MHRRLGILSMILLLMPPLFGRAAADIAPNPLTGGRAISPRDEAETDVRMVAEDVTVRIFADSIATVAVFSMHNEGERVDMEVGFPFSYPTDFVEFRAFVDGRPIMVRDGRQENVGRKITTVFWKLWSMSFDRDERREVRVEYRTAPMTHPGVMLTEVGCESLGDDLREAVQRATTTGMAEYYLESGKAWKGVLDSCRISFELAGLSGANVKDFWPEDGAAVENRVIWEYADYEPSMRVVLSYCPNMPAAEIPAFLLGVAARYPDHAPLADRIGSALASECGRRDLLREVYHSFLARWNDPIPQIMEYAPGGRCRVNYGAGNHFYTVWRMADVLFKEYRMTGELEKGMDVAPVVSRICAAIVDSLETCDLPERDVQFLRSAKELLGLSKALIRSPE